MHEEGGDGDDIAMEYEQGQLILWMLAFLGTLQILSHALESVGTLPPAIIVSS
jgi:hypothetical protein